MFAFKLLQVILSEEEPDPAKYLDGSHNVESENHPFNLDLELVLGKMPQKVLQTYLFVVVDIHNSKDDC